MSLLFHVYEPKLPDASVRYYPGFLAKDVADAYFSELLDTIPWQNDPITIFGKTYPQPRHHSPRPRGSAGKRHE